MPTDKTTLLSKQLEDETLSVAYKREAPTGGHGPDGPPNLCEWCLTDNHHMCTRVDCYRCPSDEHNRLPGVTSTMGDDKRKGGRFYHGDDPNGSRGY